MSDSAPAPTDLATDLQLLREFAQAGSQEAFGALVDRHIDLVFNAALRHVRNRHDAEDVTQAVFIALARSAAQMDRKVILPAWLYRATRFACLNVKRAELRRKRHEMALQPHEPAAAPEPSPGPLDPLWEASLPLLDDALASLGETDRTLLLLRFFQGLSVQDAGRVLGMSANTTSQRLGRAVDKLRRFFARRGIAVSGVVLASGLSAQRAGAAVAVRAALASCVKTAALTAAGTSTSTAAQALANAALIAMKSSIQAKQTAVLAALIVLLFGTVATTYYLVASGSGKTVVLTNLPTTSQPRLSSVSNSSAAGGQPAPLPVPEYLPGGTIPILASAARKNDREPGQTIEAELFDETKDVYVEAPGITGWTDAAVVRYDNVDFGTTPSQSAHIAAPATHFFANLACPKGVTGASLEVRIDDAAAAPVCVLPVMPNGDVLHRTAESVSLSRTITGRHSVYLKMTGDSGKPAINLDWFKFVHLPRPGDQRIDADRFDAMKGVVVTEDAISHLDRGDFVRYSSVQFSRPLTFLHVRCGVRKRYAGQRIRFRLDAVDGPIVAELTVRDTGEFNHFQTQSTRARPVTGTHDLYVTFSGYGVADIRWFQFTDSATPPQYPDPDLRPPPATQPTTNPTSTRYPENNLAAVRNISYLIGDRGPE